jgi:hypothetical protein
MGGIYGKQFGAAHGHPDRFLVVLRQVVVEQGFEKIDRNGTASAWSSTTLCTQPISRRRAAASIPRKPTTVHMAGA